MAAKQLKFDFDKPIQKALFSHKALAEAQMSFLASKIESLQFGEVSWLAKIESFYKEKNYITEKQINVLHELVKKYKI